MGHGILSQKIVFFMVNTVRLWKSYMVILCMVPHNSCFCLLSLEVEVEHVHNIVESSATTKK
jgi:hypothetical protein